jgi:hypothetical protein
VDVAIILVAATWFVLRVPVITALDPVRVDTVRDFTLATVWPRGNANVFMRFQVFASFDEAVRDA